MSMTTHPRTKPTPITRTFPGSEPPDNPRTVVVDVLGHGYLAGYYSDGMSRWVVYGYPGVCVRRWAELPTFPPIKKGRGK